MKKRVAYSLSEAGDLLGGISRDTIYRLEKSGDLRLVRIGGRRFVPASEIKRLTAVPDKSNLPDDPAEWLRSLSEDD